MVYIRFHFLVIFMTFFIVTTSTAFAEELEKQFTLKKMKEDVTGDGIHEDIILYGTLFSNKSNYFRNVSLQISSLFSQKWQISLESGYDPEILLLDLNQDQTADIFYRTKKSVEPVSFLHQLYTFENSKIKPLRLPVKQHVRNKYSDDFQAELYIDGSEKTIVLDLQFQREKYIDEELYDHKGKLLRHQQLHLAPIHFFEPTLISQSKGYGLQSKQYVLDAVTKEILGSIETLWYFENNDWIIVHTKWKEKKEV